MKKKTSQCLINCSAASVTSFGFHPEGSFDLNLGTNCPVFSFSSPPLVPVTSVVLALLMWPWGEPVQGPGADENLKQINGKRQVSCQLEQLPELAHSIIKLPVPGEWAGD